MEIPSVSESHIIASETNKPAPNPKPRLTPKPFAVEKNPTIKPILAPKPHAKPRPESTRIAGSKSDLPNTPKPAARPVSTNPNRPAATSFRTPNKLKTGQTTKPVIQPFKPAPPLDAGEPSKSSRPVPIGRQKPAVSTLAYSKSLKTYSAAEWSGTSSNKNESGQNKEGPITRAKSMDFLAAVGQHEEEKNKAQPEAAVQRRTQPRSPRPRPVSAIFPASPAKTETPVPAPRWVARRPLSADLTSKFESIGLSLHRKSPKGDTPAEQVPPQDNEQDKTPSCVTSESTDGVADPALSNQNDKKAEETAVNDAEEIKPVTSIKSRISLLLDSSSSPGAAADLLSPVQPSPDSETSVGVKQLIKQLTEDSTPTSIPAAKPALKPRPLPLDLTKKFSSERSPDPVSLTEAADRHEISRAPQRGAEESTSTPNDQKMFLDLKDSPAEFRKVFIHEGSEAGQPGAPFKESGSGAELHTVRASMFENIVERQSVFMMGQDESPSATSDSPVGTFFMRRNAEDGALVTATYKEPASPSSPFWVSHAFDTVLAAEENRAISESIPAAQWEDKAMTLRSRRSERTRPGIQITDPAPSQPAAAAAPEPQPRFLRVGALQKWTTTGFDQGGGLDKGMLKESEREAKVASDKVWDEVAAAPKRLKILQAEEQQKPRATYFALTGQMQELASPGGGGTSFVDANLAFKDLSVRSALGGSQAQMFSVRRNPSLEEAFGQISSSQEKCDQFMLRNHIPSVEIRSQMDEQMIEVKEKKEQQEETERNMAKMNELEREKQKHLEIEKQVNFERMKEWDRQREFERQRQKAFEKEKKEFEEKQQRQKQFELEKQNQQELERERQQHLQKEKRELERQKEIEREREREKEKQKEMEMQQLVELERQRQREKAEKEAEKLKQMALEQEMQKIKELEKLAKQKEMERQKEMEMERKRELEKQRQRDIEKEMKRQQDVERQQLEKERLRREQEQERKRKEELERIKEMEKQQLVELEKQRQREEEKEAEKFKKLALEQEMLKIKELEKERAKQEMERQKEIEMENWRQREMEKEKQRQLDLERQQFENERLRREQEKDRQRKELDRLREMEFDKAKEKMERAEAEKIRHIAKQQEAERQRLKEKQRKEEQERLWLDSHALRPKVFDLDSVLRSDAPSPPSPQHSDPSPRWREPYKPAILDIDSFTSHNQGSPSKDLFPASGILELDVDFGVKFPPTSERDVNWKVLPQTSVGFSSPVWTTSPQDPWELQSVEMSVDKPVTEPKKAANKLSPEQLPFKQEERLPSPQQHRPAFLDEPLFLSPPSRKEPQTGISPNELSHRAPGDQIWIPREPQPPKERRGDIHSHRRSHGSQELNRMRSRSMSRRSAPSSSAMEGSLFRMRSRSAHRELDLHTSVQQKQSGEADSKDSETPVRDTDSQYGTWETGLRTDGSLTPATPSSESNLSPSQRKPTPLASPGAQASQLETTTPDGPSPFSSSEIQPLTFPDAPTALLDNSALRSRAQLGKKRAPRTRPSKVARLNAVPAQEDGGNTEDWLYRDSTEAKAENKNDDSESEEQARGADAGPAVPAQPQRVALFPGVDPSALKAQLKKRGDSDNQTDGPVPSSSQISRSPKSPFLPRAARVLPPAGGKENGEEDSPQWLKELKSKKRLSHYDNES
ncbi:hypothetical protein CRENBAI_013365 [Crenichthys baileyi]|uniref:Tankyrase 1-binding protein C-terminal domain-containing protein n=1 Tax=Crenichthys baileyi TaxID=28760 RepID=A0AAV9R086_9TELE